MPRLKIVVWHGEHRSLFYVVPADASDVDVLATFTSRAAAEGFIEVRQ